MIWLSVTVSRNFSGILNEPWSDDPDQDRGEENSENRQNEQNDSCNGKGDMRDLPGFFF